MLTNITEGSGDKEEVREGGATRAAGAGGRRRRQVRHNVLLTRPSEHSVRDWLDAQRVYWPKPDQTETEMADGWGVCVLLAEVVSLADTCMSDAEQPKDSDSDCN